jgi:type IV pilus assembly protein PilM
MQVVHQAIPEPDPEKKKKFMRILVTAAPRELVAFYTAIFQKAGLLLQELETEAFALERALMGHDTATAMIVDIGAERTNFFIVDQGLPVTNRSINVGGNLFDSILMRILGVSNSEVEQIKKDISNMKQTISADLFLSAIDPIEKEIDYGFEVFLHQTGNENKRPEKIILTGGSSALPFIADYIRGKFNIKVFVGDPWARTVYQEGLKKLLDDIGPRLSVAIGLAMRNIV